MKESTVAVKFEGNTKDWFLIWIVNILLSIVTLGIYSSWAKVRTKKYFYNNTYIDGQNFDYHATGMQIFIARTIALLIIILFAIILMTIAAHLVLKPIGGELGVFYQKISEDFSKHFAILMFFGFLDFMLPMSFFALLFLLPYAVITAIKFNAESSSFNGIRFGFHGTILAALVHLAVLPSVAYILVTVPFGFSIAFLKQNFIIAVSLFLCGLVIFIVSFSFVDRRLKQFLWNNHNLGEMNFKCNTPLKPFLNAISIALISLIILCFLFFILASNTSIGEWLESGQTVGQSPGKFITSISMVLYVLWLPAYYVYKYRVRNDLYNALNLDDSIKFFSDVNPNKITWILVSNIVVTILTLGLMYPWAKIRLHRYLCMHTYIRRNNSIPREN